jgi:hypothetical protein
MQRNIKRLVTLVAFSIPGLAQAGSMGAAGAYAKISSMEQTMTADATRQNLSKTYGGKLDRHLQQLNADVQTAQGILSRMPAGRGMAFGRAVASVNARELLIDLTLGAVDTDALNGFSEAARRNLRDAIGEKLGTYGDLEDDAEAAMDALDESLGDDMTMDSNPHYSRKDSPAARKVFRARTQASKTQRRKRVRSGYVASDRGNQSRKAPAYAPYDNSSASNKSSKQSKRADKREADDKRRERALAKSAPDVNLGETSVGKRLASSENDFVSLTPEQDKDRTAQQAKWAGKAKAAKAPAQGVAEADLLGLDS